MNDIRFAPELGIDPAGQKRLRRLINRIERADVNTHNINADWPAEQSKAAHAAFAKELKKYPGVTAFFPGIFPVFVKDGQTYHI